MDFDFNDDQTMLRDSVRRWVDKAHDFERRRAIVAAGGDDAGVWAELGDLGLHALAVPARHGGLGFGPVEAMVVMEELGRGLVLAPYAAVALVATALLRDHAPEPMQAAWLPRLAAGDVRVVLAHQERQARHQWWHVEAEARLRNGQWLISGRKSVVPVVDRASAWIVPARVSGDVDDPAGVALFLVEPGAAGIGLRAYATQDGARAGDLQLDATPAAMLAQQGAGATALAHVLDIGVAALCAEAVGSMEQVLALTTAYLGTRRQFGVPIGSFQVLRHRVAEMKMQLELARSMSYLASLRLGDEESVRRRAVSQAKVQIGLSARFVGQQAVQLHGGIGVTDEYVVAHHFKRLTCIELTLGDTLHHLGEVSSRMRETAGVFA